MYFCNKDYTTIRSSNSGSFPPFSQAHPAFGVPWGELCPCGEKATREGEKEKDKEKLNSFFSFSHTQPNRQPPNGKIRHFSSFLDLFYKSLLSPPITEAG